jgi:hypothetical protein
MPHPPPTPRVGPTAWVRASGRRPTALAVVAVASLLGWGWPAWSQVPPAAGRWALNDTGQTLCRDPKLNKTVPCAGSGQDGDSGRDLTANDDSDGRAGFSFVKISADGARLPADATEWSCIRDRVTGLTWEVKTRDGGLRDMGHRYSNRGDGQADDASALVQAVNAQGLCGAGDWRLPSRIELQGLLDYAKTYKLGPAIDNDWFPNTAEETHWTSDGVTSDAWYVDFDGTQVMSGDRDFRLAVRLVRGRSAPAERFLANGDDVVDTLTGLIWRRCPEGQDWTDSTCLGRPLQFNLPGALRRGRAAAATGKGWRLPNVKELASLVDASRVAPPFINSDLFPGTQGKYWTSTHDVSYSEAVWTVDFGTGWVWSDLYYNGYPVRLVRDRR